MLRNVLIISKNAAKGPMKFSFRSPAMQLKKAFK
jgi:hypothetical protein